MAEPTTLYRDGYEMTVTAPSEVRRLVADGWSLTDDYVPFAFHDEPLEFGTAETAPGKTRTVPEMMALVDEPTNVAPAKRGRPRKAKQ